MAPPVCKFNRCYTTSKGKPVVPKSYRNGPVLRFGVFEADLHVRELRKHGVRLNIQNQSFLVLAAFLERPGEVISREELYHQLWPDQTFVDFEHNLNAVVKKLRAVLMDNAESPRFIETLARRGYRFVSPVEVDAGLTEPAVQPDLRPKLQVVDYPVGRRRVNFWYAGAISLMLAAAGLGVFPFLRGSRLPEPPIQPMPLTSYPGHQSSPSFSPDGNQVAFVWDGPKQDVGHIYVKLVGTENALQLTSGAVPDSSPSWSPDGRYIAFLRIPDKGKSGIFLIPVIGGPEHKLAEVQTDVGHGLSWCPDGKWLAVQDNDSIYLLSAETGEKRKLTRPGPYAMDEDPAFSPDGQTLAFTRNLQSEREIYLLKVSPDLTRREEPKQLTFRRHGGCRLPAWTANGREIVFSCGNDELWRMRVPAHGAAGQPFFTLLHGTTPAISRRGNRLAYSRDLSDVNIWRLEVPGVSKMTSQPVGLISSTYAEDSPRYSPDGKRIAFQSGRSGHPEIWVCWSDGSNPVQLTSLRALTTGSPHWSPDGNQIVFDSNVEGKYEVYVIDAVGGRPRRLTSSLGDDAVATWSRDGRWIYFSSNRARGTWHDGEIWRMPAAGGEAIQVTRQGAHVGSDSFDGKYIYFTREFGKTTLWRVPTGGGAEEKVQESVWGQAFDVTRSGIYFAASRDDGSSTIQFRSFATGKVATIAVVRRPVGWGLSVSPDEHYVLYTQEDRAGSDLMLVENFR